MNEFSSFQKDSDSSHQLGQFLKDVSKCKQPYIHDKKIESLYVLFTKSQNITIIPQISQVNSEYLDAYRTLQFFDQLKVSNKPKPVFVEKSTLQNEISKSSLRSVKNLSRRDLSEPHKEA